MRSLRLAIFGLAVFASPRLAHAASHYRLLYVRDAGTASCPDEMELRLAVVARLGYDPFSPNASGALYARIGQQDGELTGSVELVDENGMSRGKRELQAPTGDCVQIGHALALSISIAIDPEQAAEHQRESATNLARPAPRQAPLPLSQDEEKAHDRQRDKPPPSRVSQRDSLALSAITLVGVAPAAAFGGALWYEHSLGSLALVAGARFASAPSGDVRAGAALQLKLAAGDLGLCWLASPLEACAIGMAGASWVTGGQVRSPRTSVGPFVAFGARLALVAPLSKSVGLFAAGEGLGVTTRVRAEVDGARVWDALPLAAGLVLGARLRFP